jgi:membrane-associated protease RseP (regulator of RpoE activity)
MSDETPEPTEPQTPVEPATSTEAKKPSEPIHVPRWAAVLVAALLLVGVGFAIGWFAAPGGNDHAVPIGRFFQGGGRGPFFNGPGGNFVAPGAGNGAGNGGGTQVPAQGGAFLGVETGAASGSQAGAPVVSVVSGGPADQAGLKAGDVITAVDGTTIATPAALAQQIQTHQPGDQVTITYTRSGSSSQVQVKLGTRSSTTVPTAPPS